MKYSGFVGSKFLNFVGFAQRFPKLRAFNLWGCVSPNFSAHSGEVISADPKNLGMCKMARTSCIKRDDTVTDGVNFGVKEPMVDSSMPDFIPVGARVGCGPQNCKFYEIWEYKRQADAYPMCDSYDSYRVCGPLRD